MSPNPVLDFIVVAERAENLALSDFIRRSDPIILANETGGGALAIPHSGNLSNGKMFAI